MAQIFKFPVRDEWSTGEELVAAKMRAEGFGAEAIQTVCERLRAYREKYLAGADFDMVISGLSPGAIKKVEGFIEAFQDHIIQLMTNVFIERVSTEVALLALESEGYVRT